MEFSFSMDASPRPLIDPKAPLYASVMGAAADLGGGECVFRTRDGQTHVMTHQVLQALDRCRAFLSLAEHVQAVREILPKVPADGIGRVLDSLVARRLLISEQDFVATLRPDAASSSRPVQLLVRLGDGGDALRPLLQSIASSAADRIVDSVVLLNEASSSAARQRLQSALPELLGMAGVPVRMVDASEQRASLQRIAGKEARLRAMTDTLFGADTAATGSQRFNLALTLTAGRRSLIVDQHMRAPLRRHAEYRRGMELRAVEQLSARFYANTAGALGSGDATVESGQLLDAHRRACGAPVGSLLADNAAAPWQAGDLRGVSLSECVVTGPAETVLATYSGTRGVRHGIHAEDLFLLDELSRNALSADREAYLRQLDGGALWYGVRRAALARRSRTLPTSVDARQLLPFALPFGAGAGSSFSAMLGIARPDGVLMHMPDAWAVTAADPDAAGIAKTARTPEFDAFVADYLVGRSDDIHAAAPAARLGAAAQRLRDLGAASDASLKGYVSEYVQFVRSDLVSRLQRAAEAAGKDAPLHWLADLRAIVTLNGRALIDADAAQLSGSGTLAILRGQLDATADALDTWPVLWQRIVETAGRPEGSA